jgi:hypothetical protein
MRISTPIDRRQFNQLDLTSRNIFSTSYQRPNLLSNSGYCGRQQISQERSFSPHIRGLFGLLQATSLKSQIFNLCDRLPLIMDYEMDIEPAGPQITVREVRISFCLQDPSKF